jgi:tape measure domain-containing protein
MADAIIKLGLDDSNFTSGIQSAQAEIDKFNRKEGVTNSKIFNLNRNLNEAKRNFLSAAYNYKKLGDEGRKTDAGRKLLDIKEKAAATIRELQATKNELQELTRVSNQTSMGGGKNGLMDGLMGAASSARMFGGALVASGLYQFGEAAVEARSRIEQLEVSFSTLLGSQAQANALLQEIREYGEVTPYDTEGLSQAARLMLSYGMATNKVMPTLRMLGDISMGDKEKLQSLTLAFSQMSASGRVCKEDLNQMVNAGFNPLQIISEETGESIGELNDKVSAGKISVNQIEQAFIDATSEGGKFHGMVDNMSNTLSGKIAQMSDGWDNIKASIGGLSSPAVLKAIEIATKTIDGLTEAIEKLKEAAGDVTTGDGKYNSKTSNALKYAETKGDKEGKDEKEKEKIRKKTIQKGIAFEKKRLTLLDKRISENARKQNDWRHPKDGKKPNPTLRGQRETLDYLVDEQPRLIHERKLTGERIKNYEKALKENPYKSLVQPISNNSKNNGGITNKGGAKNTNKEVIPQGSLAELENELSEARKAASNAVGEEAYFQATKTIQAIEDKIENFKFNSYKNADNSPIKNPIDLSTLKLPKNGVTGNLMPSDKNLKEYGYMLTNILNLPKNNVMDRILPSIKELKEFGKTSSEVIAESQKQIREEIEKTQEAFKDFTESMRSKYGGEVVAFTNDFAELAKFIEEGGNTTTAAASGLVMLGDALQQIGGNGVIAKTGAVMAAIGQSILGFAQASVQAASLGPWGWLAFVGAGLGTLATMISTFKGFAEGGIIGGASNHGDMQLARVNSGEMILNNTQQARLFDLLDGGASMVGYGSRNVEFKISGQNLVGTLRNYNNKMNKVR